MALLQASTCGRSPCHYRSSLGRLLSSLFQLVRGTEDWNQMCAGPLQPLCVQARHGKTGLAKLGSAAVQLSADSRL